MSQRLFGIKTVNVRAAESLAFGILFQTVSVKGNFLPAYTFGRRCDWMQAGQNLSALNRRGGIVMRCDSKKSGYKPPFTLSGVWLSG